jgi:hypothetical protein
MRCLSAVGEITLAKRVEHQGEEHDEPEHDELGVRVDGAAGSSRCRVRFATVTTL